MLIQTSLIAVTTILITEHKQMCQNFRNQILSQGYGKISSFVPGSDSNFDDVVQDFIETLLDKEILYPSIKELNEKYQPWLDSNSETLPASEVSRYEKQIDIIAKICKEYECVDDGQSSSGGTSSSSDRASSSVDGKEKTENLQMDRVVQLMHEMRELGNPPEELIKSIEVEGSVGSSIFSGASPCPVM